MVKIRKKTSKRGTTNRRSRIKQKGAETRKKSKRDSKKNVTWKTKHPVDPGIPNAFPYKDQILAEIAEQRRQEVEQKARRKEERKSAKAKAAPAEGSEGEEGEGEGEGEAAESSLGISTLNIAQSRKRKSNPAQIILAQEDEEEVPVLINPDLPNLKAVLNQADVVLEVLDARDPLPFRSDHLESLAAERPDCKTLLILNKIDTCPRESVASWAALLRTQHPTLVFRSASAFLHSDPSAGNNSKGKEKATADDGLGVDALVECLSRFAKEKKGEEALVVAVVGLANSGKSSLINTILRKSSLAIYKPPTASSKQQGPTTTPYAQEVTLESNGVKIRLIDTPGLAWEAGEEQNVDEADTLRIRDILLRSKGKIDRLKDPVPAVAHIVKHAEHEDLMLLYNIPAFVKGDTTGFLAGVARVCGFVKKGGVLDHSTAARTVLRDWSTGRFARYTVPPPVQSDGATPESDNGLSELYAKDSDILPQLKSRKEMRVGKGLVKMVSGSVEKRKAVMEVAWVGTDDEDEDGAEGEKDVDMDGGEEVDEGEGNSGNEEDAEEAPSDADEASDDEMPTAGKRKRFDKGVPSRSPKKVAFAALPKQSRQSQPRASMGKKQKTPASPKSKSRPVPTSSKKGRRK